VTLNLSPAAQNGRLPSDVDCRAVVTSVWDYLDGHCAPELAERVDAHLASCTPCLRLRELQGHFLASVAELRERSRAPAHVHNRVREALETARWWTQWE
jgi:mycothiol system anti-sigma-R factor